MSIVKGKLIAYLKMELEITLQNQFVESLLNISIQKMCIRDRLISAGVSPNIAETEACRIEHCVSDESFLKLKQHHEKDKG